MRDTRLIVIDDLFMSSQYSTCAGKPDTAGADAEIAWLRETLAEARRLRERVWVMGHIPPGVDPYSTAARLKDICGKEAPVMFLSSDKLADLLIEYADVIRLGLFAHSHMDEIRLLKAEGSDSKPASNPAGENGVAIKMVPSISPIDGNNPSFTVARIDPDSAKLKDYEVIAASNQTGIATIWSREYDFGRTYHQAEFSSAALRETIAGFANDRDAKDEVSKAYIRNFYAGDRSDELTPFWPEYICALANYTAKAFAVCACAAGK
jgi:sphingomyelin phosphodiesterase acid-like 3